MNSEFVNLLSPIPYVIVLMTKPAKVCIGNSDG